MWEKFFFLYLCLQLYSFSQAKRTKRPYNYKNCEADQYMCKNQNCTEKSQYCDGIDHCGDNSDELYCKVDYRDIIVYPDYKCGSDSINRYIPSAWVCDGVQDCLYGSDEGNCYYYERRLFDDVERVNGSISACANATRWMLNQYNHNKPNAYTLHIAIIMYLVNSSYFNGMNATGNEIARDIENQMLVRLLRNETDPLTMNELGLYINALLVTCSNPRNFHGVDLVAELKRQVDSRMVYIHPLVFLALCNAKVGILRDDVVKYSDLSPSRGRLSGQALALLTTACGAKQSNSPINDRPDNSYEYNMFSLSSISAMLKGEQESNGGFENTFTTALLMQALFASEKEDEGDWNMEAAVKYLLNHQKEDGSFGDTLTTFFVLPVLYYKSLADISSDHCHYKEADNMVEVLNDLNLKIGKKIHVKYTVQVGDKADLSWSLRIRVIEGSTFLDVMNIAKAIDEKYDFRYGRSFYQLQVYELGGYYNDPVNERYWFLHKADEGKVYSSLIDVIPKDGEEYVMWYQSSK